MVWHLGSSWIFDYQPSIEPIAIDTVLTFQGKIIKKEVQEAKRWQKLSRRKKNYPKSCFQSNKPAVGRICEAKVVAKECV